MLIFFSSSHCSSILQVKLDCLKQKGFISQRTKLLSGRTEEFDEISPLTLKDLQTAHGRREAGAASKTSIARFKQSSLALSSSQPTPATGRLVENRKRSICSQPVTGQDQINENEAKRQKRAALMKMTSVNGVSPSRIVVKQLQLTAEQNRVIETIKKGRSIFFTGSAGTGKSFLLKRIVGECMIISRREQSQPFLWFLSCLITFQYSIPSKSKMLYF